MDIRNYFQPGPRIQQVIQPIPSESSESDNEIEDVKNDIDFDYISSNLIFKVNMNVSDVNLEVLSSN